MITLDDHLIENDASLAGQGFTLNCKEGDPSKYIRKRKKIKLESKKAW